MAPHAHGGQQFLGCLAGFNTWHILDSRLRTVGMLFASTRTPHQYAHYY
jgi:hypothetical protein